MRAVRDHHVDRPEVEAGQPAQLTGTNRSIALASVHIQRQAASRWNASSTEATGEAPLRRKPETRLAPRAVGRTMPQPRTLVRDNLQPGSISGVTQLHRGDRRNASCAESQGGKPSLQQTPTTRFDRPWPAQNGPRLEFTPDVIRGRGTVRAAARASSPWARGRSRWLWTAWWP